MAVTFHANLPPNIWKFHHSLYYLVIYWFCVLQISVNFLVLDPGTQNYAKCSLHNQFLTFFRYRVLTPVLKMAFLALVIQCGWDFCLQSCYSILFLCPFVWLTYTCVVEFGGAYHFNPKTYQWDMLPIYVVEWSDVYFIWLILLLLVPIPIYLWVHCWTDGAIQVEDLERRLRIAEGHIEAGRLLAFYQVGTLSSISKSNQTCTTDVYVAIAWIA